MRCPECGEENPAQAMFCMICGTRFSRQGGRPEGGETLRPMVQVPEPTPPPRFDKGNGAEEPEAPMFRPPSPPRVPLEVRPPITSTPPPAVTKPLLPGFLLEQETSTPPPAREAPLVTQAALPLEEPLPSPQATIPLHPSPGLPLGQAAGMAPPAREVPSDRPTTPLTPVSASPAGAPRASERVVCPQCYAQNPSGNLHCQECGSVLPGIFTGATRAVVSPITSVSMPAAAAPTVVPPPVAPPQAPAPRVTVVMPAATAAQAQTSKTAAPGRRPRANGFGPADILAVFAVLAIGAAISPLFKWMEGTDFSAFSFQGVNNPGGPALLPYAGMEWLTVGVVAAAALGLALVFLLVRVGRGPMFILAGWLAVAPFIYLAVQSILPLRVQGLELQGAPGFNAIFFGGGATRQAALTPAIWLMTGAGVFLLVAGFLAPPRGWGRLMSFFLFGLVTCGLVFFCALAYSWNLFIPKSLEELLPAIPLGLLLC